MKDRLLTDIKGVKVLNIFEKENNFEIRYIKDNIEKSLTIYLECDFTSLGNRCYFRFSPIPLDNDKQISKRLTGIKNIVDLNIYTDNVWYDFYLQKLEIIYNKTDSYLLIIELDEDFKTSIKIEKNQKITHKKQKKIYTPYPKEPYSIENYKKAFSFALKAHGSQTTPNGLPYSFHIVNVANEIINSLFFHKISFDEANVAIACALLHDVEEDTNFKINSYDLDIDNFEEIKVGVKALTKDKNLPKQMQMSDSLNRLKKMPDCIQMVKLADRITNLDPAPIFWNKAKRIDYLNEAKEILKVLKNSNPYLSKKLQDKIDNYQIEYDDDFLVFYTKDKKYLILDKLHHNYLKTFKIINTCNKKNMFFRGFTNISKEYLKNFQDRVNLDDFIGICDKLDDVIDYNVII